MWGGRQKIAYAQTTEGQMSDFALYDYCLTYDEVFEHWKSGWFGTGYKIDSYDKMVMVDHPCLYWKFDDEIVDGGTVKDHSNYHRLSPQNGTIQLGEGSLKGIEVGRSLIKDVDRTSFSFINQSLNDTGAGPTTFNMVFANPITLGSQSWTIEFWVKKGTKAIQETQYFFSFASTSPAENNAILLGIVGNGFRIFQDGVAGANWPGGSGGQLGDGRPHHVVVVSNVNGLSDLGVPESVSYEYFIDGVSWGIEEPSGAPTLGLTGCLAIGMEQDDPFPSAGNPPTGGTDGTFESMIQDLVVYPHELTHKRILEHYIAGSQGFDVPLDTVSEIINRLTLRSRHHPWLDVGGIYPPWEDS